MMMTASEVARRLDEAAKDVEDLLHSRADRLDQFEKNSLLLMLTQMREMKLHCENHRFPPTNQRFGVLARAVVEFNPAVLTPDLGGRIIEVENAYRSL